MSDRNADHLEHKEPGKAVPDDQAILEALEQAAQTVGVVVRYDKLATGDVKNTSGACKIRGVDTIIIDRRLGTRERIAALARELRSFNFETVYLPPAVRSLLEPNGADGGRANDEKTRPG